MTEIYLQLNKLPKQLSLISANTAFYKEFPLHFDLRKCLSKKDEGEESFFSFT